MNTIPSSDFLAAIARMRAEQATDLASTRADLLRALRSVGVTEVVAEYDGCGDSGNIDATALGPAGIEPAGATGSRIADFAWAFVHHRHPGFENNEGGYGELRWDIAADTIAIDHGDRIIEVSHTFDEEL